MILIDFNQLVINSSVEHGNTVNLNEARLAFFGDVFFYLSQFKAKFGSNIVFCCDSRQSWRRDFFPYYKVHRSFDREKSKINWNVVHDNMDKIKDELIKNFSYIVLSVNKAEGDDLIAVLTQIYSNHEPILIISNDNDFIQLQRYKNVYQWTKGNYVSHDNPLLFLKEHIIQGDAGDGIPKIISEDSCFVNKIRQKPMSRKKLDLWLSQDVSVFCDTELLLRNFRRNETLIDFECIPVSLKKSIIEEYEAQKELNSKVKKNASALMNYFIQNRLGKLVENIGDF